MWVAKLHLNVDQKIMVVFVLHADIQLYVQPEILIKSGGTLCALGICNEGGISRVAGTHRTGV